MHVTTKLKHNHKIMFTLLMIRSLINVGHVSYKGVFILLKTLVHSDH
ncbi:hypothetical protein BN1325_210035 [Staphylococcus aureus]|uniref:Uncharacterized protein n=1 Tax=Staphylococcus aureus TaxID=1280 RepID=A0A0U1MP17_STAAU|nr:hypothetical protein BN1321_260361 [Staphylococcus aureus]CRI14968.1 hypothetical protein BN1323_270037 [Staphylococcus aureus]CRI17222.1 hypothetical protein SAET23_220034 [Staphylococcus aureus]CRI21454.1 hypothetical protein BN1325_210035 [Staphylococcus aureus]CRI24699.1 hypothetical protein SAET23_220034 [Staphylococcus aureus]